MEMAAVPGSLDEPEFFEAINCANDRTAVQPDQFSNAIDAWVALTGLAIEVIDDYPGNQLVGAR